MSELCTRVGAILDDFGFI